MAKRDIKADVRKNGIVLYSNEIPEIGVVTTLNKEGKEEKRVIRNYVKFNPFPEMDTFSKGLVFFLVGLLVITQLGLSDMDIKHKIYIFLVIPSTMIPLFAICRQIYVAKKRKNITKRKTAILEVIYKYEKNTKVPEVKELADAKPYEKDCGFIICIKIGVFSFISLSILIPNICMVHPGMSALFLICAYVICMKLAVSRFGNEIFNPLQCLISEIPDEDDYYEAINALDNYLEIAEKIGISHEEMISKVIKNVGKAL